MDVTSRDVFGAVTQTTVPEKEQVNEIKLMHMAVLCWPKLSLVAYTTKIIRITAIPSPPVRP